ncbi:hypothetical protein AB1Y20_020322 [Prymnesium parvum]|uniref:Uncharacterized protein n=1 Tax=Prymnesium parvum TaxID=97485 RepID=A0AB34JUC7_PRYPA
MWDAVEDGKRDHSHIYDINYLINPAGTARSIKRLSGEAAKPFGLHELNQSLLTAHCFFVRSSQGVHYLALTLQLLIESVHLLP